MKAVTCLAAFASFAILVGLLPAAALAQPAATSTAPQPAPDGQTGVREVELIVGSGDWAVPAVLALPAEDRGPYPMAVLMHGFGPGTSISGASPSRASGPTRLRNGS